jgi:hypothetical protein
VLDLDSFAIINPFGAFVDICVLACSAWLSAVTRSWLGWTTYAVLTVLMMLPLTYQIVKVRMDPPGPHSGLGVGLMIVFVGLPLAVAWLLGLPIGLLCRLGLSDKQGA